MDLCSSRERFFPMVAVTFTDEDRALVVAQERGRKWVTDTEESIAHRVREVFAKAESRMGWQPEIVVGFFIRGFEFFSDDSRRVERPRVPYGTPLSVDFQMIRESVLKQLDCEEVEDDEETPVHYKETRSLLRKWASVSPYTVYRFYEYVLESATDVLREDLVVMAADCDRGESVARAAREASTKWLRAWEKGTVL